MALSDVTVIGNALLLRRIEDRLTQIGRRFLPLTLPPQSLQYRHFSPCMLISCTVGRTS